MPGESLREEKPEVSRGGITKERSSRKEGPVGEGSEKGTRAEAWAGDEIAHMEDGDQGAYLPAAFTRRGGRRDAVGKGAL